MRLLRRGEKGFTLIELLIVVAILGVLAAIVIPQVTRFIGSGEREAGETEFANIQAAVTSMMIDNEISVLVPVGVTNDMGVFPDMTVATAKGNDVAGDTYGTGDKDGFVLYQHDRIAEGTEVALVNYVQTQLTTGTYTVTADGTVDQVTTGYE